MIIEDGHAMKCTAYVMCQLVSNGAAQSDFSLVRMNDAGSPGGPFVPKCCPTCTAEKRSKGANVQYKPVQGVSDSGCEIGDGVSSSIVRVCAQVFFTYGIR